MSQSFSGPLWAAPRGLGGAEVQRLWEEIVFLLTSLWEQLGELLGSPPGSFSSTLASIFLWINTNMSPRPQISLSSSRPRSKDEIWPIASTSVSTSSQHVHLGQPGPLPPALAHSIGHAFQVLGSFLICTPSCCSGRSCRLHLVLLYNSCEPSFPLS